MFDSYKSQNYLLRLDTEEIFREFIMLNMNIWLLNLWFGQKYKLVDVYKN